MARVPFSTVFTNYSDGTFEPKYRIQIGGVSIGPGVRFGPGVNFGGVDFSLFIDDDLEIDAYGNEIVIKGIYAPREPIRARQGA